VGRVHRSLALSRTFGSALNVSIPNREVYRRVTLHRGRRAGEDDKSRGPIARALPILPRATPISPWTSPLGSTLDSIKYMKFFDVTF
jgi:hypothetical protein